MNPRATSVHVAKRIGLVLVVADVVVLILVSGSMTGSKVFDLKGRELTPPPKYMEKDNFVTSGMQSLSWPEEIQIFKGWDLEPLAALLVLYLLLK